MMKEQTDSQKLSSGLHTFPHGINPPTSQNKYINKQKMGDEKKRKETEDSGLEWRRGLRVAKIKNRSPGG